MALGLMGVAAAAQAELSGTVTAVSDYRFRGISLTNEDPALQGSIDWAGDSGFYVGAWASNIDYDFEVPDEEGGFETIDVDGDIEVDLYAGFSGGDEDGLGWDVGIVWYLYPGADDIDDYPEIYAGLSFGIFEVKQWYTNDYGGTDLDGWYTEGNASFELPAGFTLDLHAGYNYGDAFDDTEYFDYSIGVGYTLGNFDLGLAWIDTDLSDGDPLFSDRDGFNSEGTVVLSVSTTFPW